MDRVLWEAKSSAHTGTFELVEGADGVLLDINCEYTHRFTRESLQALHAAIGSALEPDTPQVDTSTNL